MMQTLSIPIDQADKNRLWQIAEMSGLIHDDNQLLQDAEIVRRLLKAIVDERLIISVPIGIQQVEKIEEGKDFYPSNHPIHYFQDWEDDKIDELFDFITQARKEDKKDSIFDTFDG